MNKNNDFTGYIGITTLIILAILISTITYGWTLSVLWKWFAVPILGLPPVSIMEAMGIALVIGFLSRQMPSSNIKDKSAAELFGAYLGSAIFYPFVILILGWIISMIM